MGKDKRRRRSCGSCEACKRKPCQECTYCKKPELKNSLRRCTKMEEPGESQGAGEMDGSKSKDTSNIEETKAGNSNCKDSKVRDGSSKNVKGKRVEEDNTKFKVHNSKKIELKETNTREKPSKSCTIDKAKLWKLINDESDCGSDSSSEEGMRCKTWHGRRHKDLGVKGKGESSKKVGKHVKDGPSRGSVSKEVRSKDARRKESKTKDSKQDSKGRHQQSSSASRTKHCSKSGSKSSKSEARPLSDERTRQSGNHVEADSSTDPKPEVQASGKGISKQTGLNPELWEGVLSPAQLLSQEPRLVVVPQFEASGLNDDIWADVHKGMVEVAELLNGMMDKNKGDEQPASPTAVRNNSVARRQSGAGR